MGNKSSKQGTSAFVHPGNRTKANQPYNPPANQFVNGQTTSHFVSYGGGNALVLKEGNGPASPQIGASAGTSTNNSKPPEYIQVTLPAGVSSGQTIQVQAPDGRLNEIIIPQGISAGDTFTVEFADDATTNNSSNNSPPSNLYAPTTAVQAVPVQHPPSQNTNYNPNYNPQTSYAQAVPANNYSSYPTATDAQAVVVDNSQPTYSSSYTPDYKPNYAPYVSK